MDKKKKCIEFNPFPPSCTSIYGSPHHHIIGGSPNKLNAVRIKIRPTNQDHKWEWIHRCIYLWIICVWGIRMCTYSCVRFSHTHKQSFIELKLQSAKGWPWTQVRLWGPSEGINRAGSHPNRYWSKNITQLRKCTRIRGAACFNCSCLYASAHLHRICV